MVLVYCLLAVLSVAAAWVAVGVIWGLAIGRMAQRMPDLSKRPGGEVYRD